MLSPGTRLGTFEVLGPLGAGGMGEVYRASDTRLRREVALKILPEAFAQDPARLARFEREARLLASLNHPGLAAIYGLEQDGPIRYIVMELVPGETLGEKLSTGPLSIRESLLIARQIAESLEAAHEAGIVHRDLKPANIKVTPAGKVKVLDLGLAKAMDPKSDPPETSNTPTVILDDTRPGVILGTAEFMSPEQARGKPLDKRTDIWSFGCVLFEMLSGRRPFTGETLSDVIAAILSSEPDWQALPAGTPDRVRALLRRCLEKDVNRRLRDIGDARLDIDNVDSGVDAAGAPRRRRAVSRFAWIAAGLALALAGAWFVLRPKTAAAPAVAASSLVILPARVEGNAPGGQLLGDGMVELLSVRLNEVPGIQVVTPRAVAAAFDSGGDEFAAARAVGAGLLVRSSVYRSGDRYRIVYSVWNVLNRTQVTGGTVDGPASDLFAMQDRLAANVATALKLPPRSHRTPTPSGLDTAVDQERYTEALGHLQRPDKAESVAAALRILTELSARAPKSPLVWAALARADLATYVLTHEKPWAERAQADAAKARELDPGLSEVNVTLGEVLKATGRASEAVGAFETALRAQPNSVEALLGLANAQFSSGKKAEAEASCRRAIALQPGYWVSYNQLGGYRYLTGDYPAAAEMYRKVVSLTPDNVRGWNNLGASLHQAGRFDEARSAFLSSIRVRPNDGGYSNLGTLEFSQGRYAAAADAFEHASALTPGKSLYWSNLGDAYRWADGLGSKAPAAYRRALTLIEQELSVDPTDASAHASAASCLAKSGDLPRARSHLERALDLARDDPDTLYQAAIVANLDHRPEEAVRRLSEARARGLAASVIERDPEFRNLRDLPAFREMLNAKSFS